MLSSESVSVTALMLLSGLFLTYFSHFSLYLKSFLATKFLWNSKCLEGAIEHGSISISGGGQKPQLTVKIVMISLTKLYFHRRNSVLLFLLLSV